MTLVLLWLAFAHGWLPLWVAIGLTVLKVIGNLADYFGVRDTKARLTALEKAVPLAKVLRGL